MGRGIIKLQMQWGHLPNPYEIQWDDIDKMIDIDVGRVQVRDVGRMVYLDNDLLTLESIEQAKTRHEAIQQSTITP